MKRGALDPAPPSCGHRNAQLAERVDPRTWRVEQERLCPDCRKRRGFRAAAFTRGPAREGNAGGAVRYASNH